MTKSTAKTPTGLARWEGFKLLGGAPCLDFANTLDWRGSDAPVDWLAGYADLIAWAARAGVLDPAAAERLRARAERDSAGAAEAHAHALALREAMHAIFAARIEGRRIPSEALAALNAALSDAPPRQALIVLSGGFAWTRAPGAEGFDAPAHAAIWSAGDLLASDRLERLRRCADPVCGWLFLDESRSGRRRWCSMADCGNRAKARRHHARHRA
ncbi:MAG: CGNR zinc finger domain-containing protein [Proteobacteria bacterium]|nr:CGNR zinc finger domain-containing protein [Pseudomonadota bacterium]